MILPFREYSLLNNVSDCYLTIPMLQNKMDISLKARSCYLSPLLGLLGLHEEPRTEVSHSHALTYFFLSLSTFVVGV